MTPPGVHEGGGPVQQRYQAPPLSGRRLSGPQGGQSGYRPSQRRGGKVPSQGWGFFEWFGGFWVVWGFLGGLGVLLGGLGVLLGGLGFFFWVVCDGG